MKRNSIRHSNATAFTRKLYVVQMSTKKMHIKRKNSAAKAVLIFCESLDMINLPLSEIFICHNTTIVLIIVSEGRMKVNL